MNNRIQQRTESTLQSLRKLIPDRSSVSFREALLVAEIQASRFLICQCLDTVPVPDGTILSQPRIRVELTPTLPSFGLSFWNGKSWVIQLSTRQSHARRRFTLFHEYKHIVDHGAADRLYRGDARHTPGVQAELAADFFAGCALVPRRLLKRAWGRGLQDPKLLAAHFDVSVQAIEVRLDQTGLRDVRPRCVPSSGSWRLGPDTQSRGAA